MHDLTTQRLRFSVSSFGTSHVAEASKSLGLGLRLGGEEVSQFGRAIVSHVFRFLLRNSDHRIPETKRVQHFYNLWPLHRLRKTPVGDDARTGSALRRGKVHSNSLWTFTVMYVVQENKTEEGPWVQLTRELAAHMELITRMHLIHLWRTFT